MYACNLNLEEAMHRLDYLEDSGFVDRFPSNTIPKLFLCLTSLGREAVRDFDISKDVCLFSPHRYRQAFQNHQRSTVMVFLALRKVFGACFRGWTSETTLRTEEETRYRLYGGKTKRILDGEFFFEITKERCKRNEAGGLERQGEPFKEIWRCGVEVELTPKNPDRYYKQFRELANRVYDPHSGNHHYPMVFFFYTEQSIGDRLGQHLKSGRNNFGSCIFCLVPIDELVKNLGNTMVERFVGTSVIQIPCSEMSRVKVVLQ